MTSPEPTSNPILDNIRRLLQQIEDSKPNLICAPADEEAVIQALEDKHMTYMVNVYASPFCKSGEVYVAKPTSTLLWGG